MDMKAVPLSKEAHSKTKIKQDGTVEHIKDMHMAPVNIFEFPEAAVEYPILFIGDKDSVFNPILMWGIEPEENLFITDGKWDGGFLPATLRFFPFVAHPTNEANQLALGLYETAEIVNEDEGELILNENGEKSEWFSKIVDSMHHVVAAEKKTAEAMKTLSDKGLFVEQELKIVDADKKESIIGGFHVIDAKKFFELSGEELKELQDSNLMSMIFAHFISLNNIKKLTGRKYKKG